MDKIMNFDVCVYHMNCSDGIMGLWCALRYKKIQYIYPSGPNSGLDKNIENQNIIFIDLCPPVNYLIELSKKSNNIVILDHHKSTEMNIKNSNILESCKNITMIFDMEKSGCQLAWDYFFNDQPRPFFVDYVADRDLWLWKLPMSKEINYALYELNYLQPTNFNKLNQLINDECNVEKSKKMLADKGEIISMMIKKDIDYAIYKSVKATIFVNNITYNVWLNDNVKYRSELGEILCKKPFKDGTMPDFAVLWKYDIVSNEWWISLRTTSDLIDLSLIAQSFGGGGHKKASGFSIKGGKLRDYFIPSQL